MLADYNKRWLRIILSHLNNIITENSCYNNGNMQMRTTAVDIPSSASTDKFEDNVFIVDIMVKEDYTIIYLSIILNLSNFFSYS